MDPLIIAVAAISTIAGFAVGWLLSTASARRHIGEASEAHRTAIITQQTLFSETAKRLGEAQLGLQRVREDLEVVRTENARLREDNVRVRTELTHQQRTIPEKMALLEQAQGGMTHAFDALAGAALRHSTEEFLKLAEQKLSNIQQSAMGDLSQRHQAFDELVRPIRESLAQVDRKLGDVEQNRVQTGASIGALLQELSQQHSRLRGETENLVRALRTPMVRGRWGEMQLRRVVELAGLIEQSDFEEQPTAFTETGRMRPDLIVRLPAGRTIVVDAKVPLEAYLAAIETQDEAQRRARMRDHARQVREHVMKLSAKGYWDQFQPSPELVIMFLGAEAIYHGALQEDPELIEFGASRRVLLAGPMSLIGVLSAVAQGWRHERLTDSAEEIRRLGKELYERVGKMTEHLDTLRMRLDSTVRAFNDTVGSYEGRVLVTARKFKELGATSGADIDPLQALDSVPRVLQSANLLGLPEDAIVDGEAVTSASTTQSNSYDERE
jgi:DNA recombination protein RmuC